MGKHYNIIVIGSGGGTKLVSSVAALRKKVAIIEREKLGGTCLNRGCIPSKMLIHLADIVSEIEEAKRFEMHIEEPKVDFSALVKRVSNTIDAESASIEPAYEKNPNIDYYHGQATFKNSQTILVNGEEITADKILIAVGADAAIPNIPGLVDTPYMTFRDALRNETKPKSLTVLGGGYIATELGYFFAALGVDVKFIVRSKLIKNEDFEIVEEFTRVFSKRFNIVHGTPTQVSYDNQTFSIRVDSGDTIESEHLLVATGFAPNTKDLGLENTHVTLSEKGHVEVNEYLQTQDPNIYALGDCIGKYLFRHSANFEGEYLFHSLFVEKHPIKYPPMPHAVFTSPQVGAIGITEQQALEKKIPYFVGKCPYSKSAMGMALMSDSGLVKLLFHKENKKLIGAHIVGYQASIMIHMLIAYMQMDATLEDLLETIYIHPALPEIIRNAARDAKKNV